MRRGAALAAFLSILIMLPLVATPALPQQPTLVTDSYTIPAGDPGIQLFVRKTEVAPVSAAPSERGTQEGRWGRFGDDLVQAHTDQPVKVRPG